MTRFQWEQLPRKRQLWVLRHMGAATTAAMFLSYDQLERILYGFISAGECKPKKRCAACKFGWTKVQRRTGL